VVVALLAGLLALGGVADRRASKGGGGDDGRALTTRALMPTAAPTSALSSSWYCPGATAAAGGQADGTVAIANTGNAPLEADVTIVPTVGEARSVAVTVGPRGTASVHEADVVQAPQVAAVVDFRGGGGAVEQVVEGPQGRDVSPCASAASDHWYFATGTTDKDATLLLALFNPFPGDAIVDLSFATDEGPAAPTDFQGLVVPARGLLVVNVGDRVRRRLDVATSVVARTGRVVAGRVQTTANPPGVTATLGAPSAGPEWTFADGVTADGVSEQYHLYNPGGKEAQLSLEAVLDQGEAEPFPLTVPPGGTLTVAANDEPRIPKGVGHAVLVHATNGVGVVVERTVDAVKPSARTGTADVLGARRSARRWALVAGGTGKAEDEVVSVLNPGSAPVNVSFTALQGGEAQGVGPAGQGLDALNAVPVPAGRRVSLRMGDHVDQDRLSLMVSATGPVVVERGLARVGKPGIASTIGVPLG
jgi:hypothetical protein